MDKSIIADGNPELLRINSSDQVAAKRIAVDAGDNITGLAGLLLDGNHGRELLTDPNINVSTIPGAMLRAVTMPKASEITIGNMNLRRFFDDVDNPVRKEPVLTQKAYTQRLAKAAHTLCVYMQTPDIVGITDFESQSVLIDMAAATNDKVGDALFTRDCKHIPDYGVAHLSDNSGVELDGGFLVSNVDIRPGVKRVEILSVERVAATVKFTNPDGTSFPLYARAPILLRTRINSRNAKSKVLSILLNHWTPRLETQSIKLGTNGWKTQGDKASAVRLSQANHLANWLQKRKLAASDEKIIVQGGFDTSEFTNGRDELMQIVTGGTTPQTGSKQSLFNLTLQQPLDERYSVVSDGQAQALDHFLVNFGNARHTRVEYARINADFGEDNFSDFTIPVRSSDRDPSVFYWNIAEPE